MRHVIPPKFLLLYDIALQEFYQGKPPYKTFSFANFFIFTNQATTQQQSFAYLHYFWLENPKKEASHETLFFLFYSLNINMTLVSDSPHVASLLRINISKFGYALQAFFILRYSPHVASLLRINISKLGCALQANFMLRYSPHVASLLRINISKFGCALQACFTTFIYRNVVLALLELRQCT